MFLETKLAFILLGNHMKQVMIEILPPYLLLLFISNCISYLQIRVKHMLSQGAIEQSSMTSGYNRSNMINSGRILETNTENLVRMVILFLKELRFYIFFKKCIILLTLSLELSQVSYCENDVDCRRLLQLAHFGEKFNSSTCQKTCDNCLKITSFIEKDVTEIAKQLVWEQFLYIYFFHPSTY